MKNSLRKSNGFALIELIIVIAIAGTISLIVLPNVGNTLNNINLQIVSGKLLDDIRYVQNYSTTNHCNTWITIDAVSNSYSYGIYGTPPNSDPQLLVDPSTNQPAIIDLNDYNGVSITSESINGGFNWLGVPTTSSQIILNSTTIINVEDETGFVYKN